MRYGQHFIEKNGEGVLAFINPHGYLENPTFRGMRWSLLNTYDKIFTIDLHGNAKKNETTPDGGKDENVFDIQQGVSINILVKNGKETNEELGKVNHFDLYGLREEKYEFLNKNSLKTIDFNELPNRHPMYYMDHKNFEAEENYSKGFSLDNLFLTSGLGITTAHDDFVIQDNKHDLKKFYQEFKKSERNAELLHEKFEVRKKRDGIF